jgi:mannobiose 2-epimerase
MKKLAVICLIICAYKGNAQQMIFDSVYKQMEYSAKKELIDVYYPANIDSSDGGYLSNFTFDFKPGPRQDKMIVTQARHMWTTARAAGFYKDTNYITMSRHGYHFLRDKMWDKAYGGFYTLVSKQGKVIQEKKEAYGNAFAIYALAAYYDVSRDTAALGLATRTFLWLETNSHDPVHKGYYQHLERDGTPTKRTSQTPPNANTGYKDQNSSIHLLEAFTELYHVWPDTLLRSRLQEMLILIRDRMVYPRGYLQLFFTADWTPVSNRDSSKQVILNNRYIDHVSFGHDVETAYLMMEASEALGNRNDVKTKSVGKKMVDHALKNGWDANKGGFYDQGFYYKNQKGISIIKESKNWWAQAEGLNTLAIFSELYPDDPMNYGAQFLKLWGYTWQYLIDHEHGDWYEEGLDNDPERKTSDKAHIWKSAYHNFRSLSNCIRLLKSE